MENIPPRIRMGPPLVQQIHYMKLPEWHETFIAAMGHLGNKAKCLWLRMLRARRRRAKWSEDMAKRLLFHSFAL